MGHWSDINNTDIHELGTLDSLVKSVSGNVFIDVGCFIGGFTAVMAREAKKRGGQVYSIDLFKDSHEPLDWWKEHATFDIKNLFIHNMEQIGVIDTIKVISGVSWETAGQFKNNSVDFVFIDADHHYESVKKDILAWYPKVKEGGIISGHDFNINAPLVAERDVQKAVEEIFTDFKVENRIWWLRKPEGNDG